MKEGHKLKLGVTVGDVNGISIELIIKVFGDPRMMTRCTPVLYGSARALVFYKNLFKSERLNFVTTPNAGLANARKINVIDVGQVDRVEPGVPSPKAGLLAFQSLERACDDLAAQQIDLLVTLPIDKATIQNKEFSFPGHTEYLTEKFKSRVSLMLMLSDNLRVAVVTGHVPLRDVAALITFEQVFSKLLTLNDTLRIDFNINKPKIAVLGLNPHAGDNGLIGDEEQNVIVKVVKKAREGGILAHGPFPADGFFASGTYRKYDAVLAMYHDQGLIPFKVLAGGHGVNYTAGLDIIRTSPDHGTAYDLAGKGEADETSFRQAIFTALDLYATREENIELRRNAMRHISISALTAGEDEEAPEMEG